MNKPLVLMFSGQGSQYFQMGKELFNHEATFRRWMLDLDMLVSKQIGCSVVDELYNSQKRISDPFENILYTHAAIFMVEYALCQVLLEKRFKPAYLLGASLGEFTSAAVAGIMSAEDVLECVVKQAVIFERYCSRGRMIAIVGSSQLFAQTPQLCNNSELVAVNNDVHYVISVDYGKFEEIITYLEKRNTTYQVLPVSYGFHSSSIDSSKKYFMDIFRAKTCKSPAIPLISCMHGEKVTELNPAYFWDIVRQPIQFRKAIHWLEGQHACCYIDLGPSGTLATLVKYILPRDRAGDYYMIMNPFHQELKNLSKLEGLWMEHHNLPFI